MRTTWVAASRLAWRMLRHRAAVEGRHGTQILTLPALAARLAGGFHEPVTHESLQRATAAALAAGGFKEIGPLCELPGMLRASTATLDRAWRAGLDLEALSGAAPRLADLALLETRVREALPATELTPPLLAAAALANLRHAPGLLGPVRLERIYDIDPCWRPLIEALSAVVLVEHHAPQPMAASPPAAESCANPAHEVLEAVRWVRRLIASGLAAPQEIALTAASLEDFDDALRVAIADTGLPIHSASGVAALARTAGQRSAALAAVLLNGLSHERVLRLLALCPLAALPETWRTHLPAGAPLTRLAHWREAVATEPWGAALLDVLELLDRGPIAAAQAGERLLPTDSLALWRQALLDAPPEALETSLAALRLDDRFDPAASAVWCSAATLVTAPRPYVRLLGLTSRQWPRREFEDPLLPAHIVDPRLLLPLSNAAADRRNFALIRGAATGQAVLSRSRRGSDGRLLAASPLWPREGHATLRMSRIPEHAASESGRLLARPGEFDATPLARSAAACWQAWRRAELTAHDGLVRANHPALLRAAARAHSAESLRLMLRDPLAFLWRYALGFQEPEEAEEPFTLDALAQGSLVHQILERVVREPGENVEQAAAAVAEDWERAAPTPPRLLWQAALAAATADARRALESAPAGAASYAELRFGAPAGEEAAGASPWDPAAPVSIPSLGLTLTGKIDRLDVGPGGRHARVYDYKTGSPPKSKDPLVLRGGEELQRCLYSYAVRALLPAVEQVETSLLYTQTGELHPLTNPAATLEQLERYLGIALAHLRAGHSVAGAGAAGAFNKYVFALPAHAATRYLPRKEAAAAALLSDLAPLWEEP
jgi:hypothetical protein